MAVEPTSDLKIRIVWDDRAEAAADFAGYKIYRSTAFPTVDSRQLGVCLADHYHEQVLEDPSDVDLAAFSVPPNPNLSASDGTYKPQEPAAWGPYHLIKRIPVADLAAHLNAGADAGQWRYAFEDDDDLVAHGFTYWYYVAAYDDEQGEIAEVPYTSLETHRHNFNGRSGLWEGTYHYAVANSFYPDPGNLAALKAIGVPFILRAPLASLGDLLSGELKVRVTPNPYKRRALHDTGIQHLSLIHI